MKRNSYIDFWIIFVFLAGSPLLAVYGPADRGNLGVGFMLGSPTGATAKYWMTENSAVDMGLGWGLDDDDLTIYADYLWHDFKAFSFQTDPRLQGGKIPLYIGLGARGQMDNDHFGVRAVLGSSWLFPRNPFELYAEVAPVLVLADDVEGDFDGAVGIRYYFPY